MFHRTDARPLHGLLARTFMLWAVMAGLHLTHADAGGAVIASTLGGGAWHSGATWVGGNVPTSADSVAIVGPVVVDGPAACLALEVTAAGSLAGGPAAVTLAVVGSVANQGTVGGAFQPLTVEIGADLVQDGAWRVMTLVFTGPGDHRIAASPGVLLEGDLEAIGGGQVWIDTPLLVEGSIDGRGGRLLLNPLAPLTVRAGIVYGELQCNGAEVRLESWSYLQNATLDGAVLTGVASVAGTVVFTGGVTVMDILQNNPTTGSAHVVIEDGLTVHGELRNNTYGLTVEVSGDLVVTGTIRCSWVMLDDGLHHLRMGPSGDIATSLMMPEFGSGIVRTLTDIQVSGGFTLGLGGQMILEPGTTVYLSGHGSVASGTLVANGNAITMHGLGVVSTIEVQDAVAQGALQVGPQCLFTGGLVVADTLQSGNHATPDATVEGLLHNTGLIHDGNLPLTVTLLGDAWNQGGWENSRLVIEPTDPANDQTIAIGTGIDVPDVVMNSGLAAGPFQWFRNGQPIVGATGPTINFVTLGPADLGNYHCVGNGVASRLVSIVTDWVTGVSEAGGALEMPSVGVLLGPLAPNPARGRASLDIQLASPSAVELGIYDVQGRLVQVLVQARLPAGRHSVAWNAADVGLGPGVYFLRLDAGAEPVVRKVTLLD